MLKSRWLFAISHLDLEFSQPAVRAAERARGAALVAAVFHNGTVGDGPLQLAEQARERSSSPQSLQQSGPFDPIHQVCEFH